MIDEQTAGVTGPVQQQYDVVDFATMIRDRYPGSYDEVDDTTLTNAILEKYPEYQPLVNFDTVKKKEDEFPLSSLPADGMEPSQESPSVSATDNIVSATPVSRDTVNTAKTKLDTAYFDRAQYTFQDMESMSPERGELYEKALRSPQTYFSLAEIAGVDLYMGYADTWPWGEEQKEILNSQATRIIFGEDMAVNGINTLVELAKQDPNVLEVMGISQYSERPQAFVEGDFVMPTADPDLPFTGDVDPDAVLKQQQRPKSQEDLDYEIRRYVEKDLMSTLAKQYMKLLPTEYQKDPAYIEGFEQYFLEEYGAMMDIDQDGVVGSVPFAKWEGFKVAGGLGPGDAASFAVYPKWTGYIDDLWQAGKLDAVSAYALLMGDMEERRKAVQESDALRQQTRQYVNTLGENIDEGEIQRLMEQGVGAFMEAAPVMSVLVPSGIAMSSMGMGPGWVAAMTALQGSVINTSVTAARMWEHPAFKKYRNSQTNNVISADEYERLVEEGGGDGYTEFTDVNARNGFLSKAFLSNVLVDGVTSVAFVRGLKSVAPNNVTGVGMTWWKHHLLASGISVPQASMVSGVVAMQQYIDQAQLEGRMPSWAEIRDVGIEASIKGGIAAGAMSTAGGLTGMALARDQYGRGGRNMKFFQRELMLLKELNRDDVSTQYKMNIEQELIDLYNTPQSSRLLVDEEFYRTMPPDDSQKLRLISLRQTDLMRKARTANQEQMIEIVAEFETLAQARRNIESLHEVRILDDGGQLDPLTINIPDIEMGVPLSSDGSRQIPAYVLANRPYARWYEEAKSSNATLDRVLLDRWRQEPEAEMGARPPVDIDAIIWNKLLPAQMDDKLIRLRDSFYAKGGVLESMTSLKPLVTEEVYNLLPEGTPRDINGFFSYFLQARQAAERNAFIYNKAETQKRLATLKKKKTLTEKEQMELDRIESRTGSGLSDREAAEFIKALPDDLIAALDEVTPKIRQQMDETAKLLVEYGFWSEEKRQYLREQMPNYITLFGSDEVDANGVALVGGELYPNVPRNFSARYPFKAAEGREGTTADAVGRAIQQQERAITLGMTNKALHKYWEFFNQNPEPKFYRTFTEDSYALASKTETDLPSLKDSNGQLAPNVLLTYANGEPHYLMFLDRTIPKENLTVADRVMMSVDRFAMKKMKDGPYGRGALAKDGEGMVIPGHRMVESLTNMTPRELPLVWDAALAFTAFFSPVRKTFTSYNPFFFTYAGPRDALGGTVRAIQMTNNEFGYGLLDDKGNKISTRSFLGNFYKNIPLASYAVGRHEFNSMGPTKGLKTPNEQRRIHKHYNEARKYGLVTGYGHMDDLLKIQADLKKASDPSLRDKAVSGIDRANFFKMIEAMNNTAENGVRFSSYYTLREMGVGPERAAAFARDLTVDFTRTGRSTNRLGQLYWFFNPSVEGLDNFYTGFFRERQPLRDPVSGERDKPNNWKVNQQIAIAGVGLGMFLTEWNQTFGDVDETGIPYYDYIDQHVKDRNFVIMIPGTEGDRILIPKQYGLGFLPDMGRELSQLMHGKQSPVEFGVNAIASVKHNFSPVMVTDHSYVEDAARQKNPSLINALSDLTLPSFYQPYVDLLTNEMFDGRPLEADYVQDMSPAYRAWMSPQPVQEFFQMINDSIGGGDKYQSGTYGEQNISWNPDYIWYPLKTYMGGAYSALQQVGDYYSTRRTVTVGERSLQAELDAAQKKVDEGRFYFHDLTGAYVREEDVDPDLKYEYEYQEDVVKGEAEFIKNLLSTPNRLLNTSGTPVLRYYYQEPRDNLLTERYWETYERLRAKRNSFTDLETLFDREGQINNMPPPDRDRLDGQVFGEEGEDWRQDAYILAGMVQNEINSMIGGGLPMLRNDAGGMTNMGVGTEGARIRKELRELGDAWNMSDEDRVKKYKLEVELAEYQQRLEELQIVFLRYADQYLKPDP